MVIDESKVSSSVGVYPKPGETTGTSITSVFGGDFMSPARERQRLEPLKE
jgi:hypothetical protein